MVSVDISIVQVSVFDLPSARRAGAIVYDGTVDLDLWRPPGPDRALRDAYGDELPDVLRKERDRSGPIDVGTALRLHPGKLHCDFLVWIAGRPPHGDARPSGAPDVATVGTLARRALEFASERGVVRVAFPALGEGRGAADAHDRVAAIARAADTFKLACFNAGLPCGVDEVLICDPSREVVTRARRLVSRVLQTKTSDFRPSRDRKATMSRRGPSRKRTPPGLDPADVARARPHAQPYDRTKTYGEGEWLLHPTFGLGRVEVVELELRIKIRFEDGAEKMLIHGR